MLCVPTSEATRAQAERLGIPLTTLDETPQLDLTVDGADEIDDQLRLIKGGGGALLREKIVATASDQMVVIADESKLVKTLGIVPAAGRSGALRVCWRPCALVEAIAAEAGCQRRDQAQARARTTRPFVTDQGNLILDCAFGSIPEPEVLAFALKRVPGVVEHGLFLGLADLAIVAGSGGVRLCAAQEPDAKWLSTTTICSSSARARAGSAPARLAAELGAKVGIAEEYRVGGTCVIRGCVPKKLLVYGSRYGSDFADARGFGWTCDGLRIRLADADRQRQARGRPAERRLYPHVGEGGRRPLPDPRRARRSAHGEARERRPPRCPPRPSWSPPARIR